MTNHLRQFGYAPGDYFITCTVCGEQTIAAKRAIICKTCAIEQFAQEYSESEAVSQPKPIRYYQDIRGGEEEHFY